MASIGLEGVSGRARWPRTTTRAEGQPKPVERVGRRFRAEAPDRLWLGDISYLGTEQGWLYLAVLLDVFSRRIVGWATAAHLRTELPLAALRIALRDRRPKPDALLHHTDCGSQYSRCRLHPPPGDRRGRSSAAGSP